MKPILGILLGEAAGIGPETVAKVCAQNILMSYCRPLLIGDARVLKQGMKIAGVQFPIIIAEDLLKIDWNGAVPIVDLKNLDPDTVEFSKIDAKSGRATGEQILTALNLCKDKIIEGFVYAPLNKAALKCGGFDFESEISMMAHYLEFNGVYGEMNVVNELWTTRATGHIPLKDVSANLTTGVLLEAIRLAHCTLKRSGFESPRIAVCALNPHAGENGSCGREEIDVIMPAIKLAQSEGIDAMGPYPADTIFINAFKGMYDAVTTLFHDQGQIALKLRNFQDGVTVSAGLPYPIATPAHGTAFDIAGKGAASTAPLEKAVMLASKMAQWH